MEPIHTPWQLLSGDYNSLSHLTQINLGKKMSDHFSINSNVM